MALHCSVAHLYIITLNIIIATACWWFLALVVPVGCFSIIATSAFRCCGSSIMSHKRHQEEGKPRSEGTSNPEDKRRRTTFQKYESFFASQLVS